MSNSSGSARVPRAGSNMRFSMVLPRSRRSASNDLMFRTSPGPDQTIPDTPPTDGMYPPVALFRVARPEGRTAQPGNYRLGEQGVITSGRVIPVSSHLSSQNPHPSQITSSSSQPNQVSVRRIIRRKERAPPPVRSNIAAARLLKEAQQIGKTAPPGCYAAPKSDDLFEWAAVIEGPCDTVYAGGVFFCNISVQEGYPFHPPKIVFLTRIYHCNINTKGEVCVDILREKWKSTMTISTVLQSILSLMYQCNPDDPLVTSIGSQYKEDREQFEKTARIWTTRYAT